MANSYDNELSVGDLPVVATLAAGGTVGQAARAGGTSDRTVGRRLKDPAFRRAGSAVRDHAVSLAAGLLAGHLADAVAQLHLIATSGASERCRLTAATTLLELALRYREHGELTDRLACLEEAAAGASGP